MAITLSLINMKGGVGKTTLASQIAHAADQADFRTLAIDLDPQSNLSQSLMSPQVYVKHLDAKKPTVVQIFENYIPTSEEFESTRPLNVQDVILKNVGYWANSSLDLIPSRLELSRVLKNPTGKERRLAKALANISSDYDLIIIDCAPTESILTEAAYFASRYIIVPVKPEFMATIGLPLLARSIKEFKLENSDHALDLSGIVFNHSATYTSGPEGQRSMRDVYAVAQKREWKVFENHIPYSASYPKSAREGSPIGKTSYVRPGVAEGFKKFADELFNSIGLEKAVNAV